MYHIYQTLFVVRIAEEGCLRCSCSHVLVKHEVIESDSLSTPLLLCCLWGNGTIAIKDYSGARPIVLQDIGHITERYISVGRRLWPNHWLQQVTPIDNILTVFREVLLAWVNDLISVPSELLFCLRITPLLNRDGGWGASSYYRNSSKSELDFRKHEMLLKKWSGFTTVLPPDIDATLFVTHLLNVLF